MFRLLRYFSFTSLILMVLATVVIGTLHRVFEKNDLLQLGESHSIALTQTFVNVIWPKFRGYTDTANQLDIDALRQHPDVTRLNVKVRELMRNTSLLKLNISQLDGRTIFSTDATQIGRQSNLGRNREIGFLTAQQGQTISLLTHHASFSDLDGEAAPRDVLESYIPLRRSQDAPIEGVLEIYTDVTDTLATSVKRQRLVMLSVIAALAVLYGIFCLIVKYADGVIKKQHEQQRLADQNLHHMSTHDALTNLPNRMLLLDRIKQSLSAAERRNNLLAVAFIDLDNFKTINDSLGHHVGDEVLKTVSQRLSLILRKGDTIARLGGDEFVIALPDVATRADTFLITQKVLDTIAVPISTEGHELHLTASIGIALYPEHGQDVETLMRNADMAMYSAKQLGRNRHQIYLDKMSAQVQKQVKIEHEMRRALDNQEFVLYYQPIIDMKSGIIVGAEALLRWPGVHEPWLSPTEFIPMAEECGLIVPLSEWVLGEACNQLHAWHKHGLGLDNFTMAVNLSPRDFTHDSTHDSTPDFTPDFTMAVNVSPRHFATAGLGAMVAGVIERSKIDPGSLHLEITEGLLMGMNESVRNNFEDLKNLGIKFSLDDFGTGYSSLGYLRRFSIHLLKIDQSFVRELPDNADNVAIVTAIIALANSLGLTVIAEGIETPAQLALLTQLGCHRAQGFLFSHPIPATEFLALASQRRDMRVGK